MCTILSVGNGAYLITCVPTNSQVGPCRNLLAVGTTATFDSAVDISSRVLGELLPPAPAFVSLLRSGSPQLLTSSPGGLDTSLLFCGHFHLLGKKRISVGEGWGAVGV